MTLHFDKYQGTGNDFILLDNTSNAYDNLSINQIKLLCDRKYGIGADGLILIQRHRDFDFEMIYYNADGTQSFCGNGSRCAVLYAAKIGLLTSSQTHFVAIDGPHDAWLCQDEVKIKMSDVQPIQCLDNAFVIDTGSPHYVLLDDNHNASHVEEVGRRIRYSDNYKAAGINVNLLEIGQKHIRVATYERGVEHETLSCGTGVTGAALVYAHIAQILEGKIPVHTKGGPLMVEWKYNTDQTFSDVYLIGPAHFVFKGTYEFKG